MKKLHALETGWYGLPGSGKAKDRSRTHAVYADGHMPICGSKFRPGMSFQWCAAGVVDDYIDCAMCKRRLLTLRRSGKVREGIVRD